MSCGHVSSGVKIIAKYCPKNMFEEGVCYDNDKPCEFFDEVIFTAETTADIIKGVNNKLWCMCNNRGSFESDTIASINSLRKRIKELESKLYGKMYYL